MKIILIYFTGTYNTRHLANKVKEKFEHNGHSCDIQEITADAPLLDVSSYDLVGFGYPIYGFNSPLPFNNYVKKLNYRKGKKYFIFKNSGETFAMNNSSSRILIRRCKRKKLQLIDEYHFIMPYNIHFPFDKAFVKEILEMNKKLLDVMYYNIENKIIAKIKSKFIYNLCSSVVGIQKIGGPLNSFFYKVQKDKCNHCLKCISNAL